MSDDQTWAGVTRFPLCCERENLGAWTEKATTLRARLEEISFEYVNGSTTFRPKDVLDFF